MKKFQGKMPQGDLFQQYQGGTNEDMKNVIENVHSQTEESLSNPL